MSDHYGKSKRGLLKIGDIVELHGGITVEIIDLGKQFLPYPIIKYKEIGSNREGGFFLSSGVDVYSKLITKRKKIIG